MKIVVTGGAGFIGSNLVRNLLAVSPAAEIAVIDDFSTGFRENLDGLDIQLIEGSITSRELLEQTFLGADSIVHLAALGSVPRSIDDPVSTHHVNASGTLNVLEASRKCGGIHTIIASSSSVYGSNPTIPKTENMATFPSSPYAASKLAAEGYSLSYSKAFSLPVMAFRFFNVFGPFQRPDHQYAAVIPKFLFAAINKQPLEIFGDGTQSRDFTYVSTVVQTLSRAVHDRVSHQTPVNLAYGNRISLQKLVAEIERISGLSLTIDSRPQRKGDVLHSQADASLLREIFPSLEELDFREGLRLTFEWMSQFVSACKTNTE